MYALVYSVTLHSFFIGIWKVLYCRCKYIYFCAFSCGISGQFCNSSMTLNQILNPILIPCMYKKSVTWIILSCMCFFKSCNLLEVRWVFIFEECMHMLALCLGLALWSFWCRTDLILGTWDQGRLLREGNSFACMFEWNIQTFREVWCGPVFLAALPSPSRPTDSRYPVRAADDAVWGLPVVLFLPLRWGLLCFLCLIVLPSPPFSLEASIFQTSA